MYASRWPAPPVGLIITTIPLSNFPWPTPHLCPSSVEKEFASVPHISSTITTTIWLEVSLLKFSSFCSSCSSSHSERKSGNSFDRLFTSRGGDGLSGMQLSSANARYAGRKNQKIKKRFFIICQTLFHPEAHSCRSRNEENIFSIRFLSSRFPGKGLR